MLARSHAADLSKGPPSGSTILCMSRRGVVFIALQPGVCGGTSCHCSRINAHPKAALYTDDILRDCSIVCASVKHSAWWLSSVNQVLPTGF